MKPSLSLMTSTLALLVFASTPAETPPCYCSADNMRRISEELACFEVVKMTSTSATGTMSSFASPTPVMSTSW